MPVVPTHRAQPTDVLASDVWSQTGTLLCKRGTLLVDDVLDQLKRFGVEMIHVDEREDNPIYVSSAQAANLEAEVEDRFQEVQGDRFLMRLKTAVLSTIMTHEEERYHTDVSEDFVEEASSLESIREKRLSLLSQIDQLKERENELLAMIEEENDRATAQRGAIEAEIQEQMRALQENADQRNLEISSMQEELRAQRGELQSLIRKAGLDAGLERYKTAFSEEAQAAGLRCLEVLDGAAPATDDTAVPPSGEGLRCLAVLESGVISSPPEKPQLRTLLVVDEVRSRGEQ